MILFLIAASACTVVIIAVSLALNVVIDEGDCLRRDRLHPKKKDADIVKRLCLALYAAAQTGLQKLQQLLSCCNQREREVEFVAIQDPDDGTPRAAAKG